MARSFSANCGLDALRPHLADLRGAVPGASGGLIFVSGPLAQQAAAVADLVRHAWRGVPACVVPAAGVLNERGELEGESAAAGVLWSGGRVTAIAPRDEQVPPGSGLREALARALGTRAGSAILFGWPERISSDTFGALAGAAPNACLFGAGTVGGRPIAVTADGDTLAGPLAALVLAGQTPPLVDASSACRLISGFHPIEEACDGMVLRAGGQGALDLLSASSARAGARAGAQQLILAAIADPADEEAAGRDEGDADRGPRYVVRPIRGLDPGRRGVLLGDEARAGARLAFAMRDAAAARAALEASALGLSRSATGSAPRFALYMTCAGRGQRLHGGPGVEARILRQRFADLPIAGMHAAFELAPWAPGQVRLALYTGVLALFRSPS